VPINSSGDFSGTFWDLFSVYTVLGGITVVLLFPFHGATFLTLRTTGDLCERATAAARRLSVLAALVLAAFLSWTVAVAVDRNDKSVFPPILPALLGIAAIALAVFFVARRRSGPGLHHDRRGPPFSGRRRSSRASTHG
jgi:cytochrome d ubiquinol oxidase subunit II